MELEIEIKNYRCFPDSKPAKLRLGNGFGALLGVNNSGKSSLLRFFYEFRPLFAQLGGNPSWLTNLLRLIPQGAGPASVSDTNEVFNNKNQRDIELCVRVLQDANGVSPPAGQPNEIHFTYLRSQKGWIAKIPVACSDAERQNIKVHDHHPPAILLGLPGRPSVSLALLIEAFRALSDTLYLGPFRNAINVDAGNDYFDIKVGKAFISEWRVRKTGANIEENEAIVRLTEDIRRVFGFGRLEINPSDDNTTLKIFINNRSYKLSEQGAGLTQFILVLANAAIRKPTFIFIDEPELNLHPSLQIDFLTTLASYCRFGVLFGTHSIGLARAVADRIYSLRRIAEGETQLQEYEATPRLSEFLGELGFGGYQELGFAKVLLVEGPTDVPLFQQLLRIYEKDHKVVILPLGGKSLVNDSTELQLTEIKRICKTIAAVIDSEKGDVAATVEPSRLAFQEMCGRTGINCRILDRRATENYFTDRAVKLAKGDNFRALSSYEKLRDLSPSWHKRENWRVAREMTRDELSSTDLGRFLDSL